MKLALGFSITLILVIIACFLPSTYDIAKTTHANTTSVSECNCDELPSSFNWLGKRYILKSKQTNLEPGMKFGYMKCINGQFVVTNDDDTLDVVILHDAPETDVRDIILITNGKRFLYIPL